MQLDTTEISEKELLRQESLRHRSRMHYDIEDTDQARQYFFDSIKPKKDQIIAAYWPKDKEFDTYPILEQCLKEGLACALPVVVEKGNKHLKFARWDESIDLQKGAYDILEPATQDFIEPDIIIVPLLAFDRKGYRLGYGGGYFDTTLRDLRSKKEITAVGLAYAQQACLFNLPVEDHDEPLDWVITPAGTHYYGE